MMEHSHYLYKELREKGWTQRDLPPEVHQPSFLRGDESDAQLGFKFEWLYHADIAYFFDFFSPFSNTFSNTPSKSALSGWLFLSMILVL